MKAKQACPRCCGSGSYSYNPRHGTVCYRCSGAGFVMVDDAAAAKKQSAAAKRAAAVQASRAAYTTAMAAVKREFNAAYGYDLHTELGIDQLNAAVVRATGKTLVAHCEARVIENAAESAYIETRQPDFIRANHPA